MPDVPVKVLLVSTVPSTLWAFFRRLPTFARERKMEIAVAAAPGPELEFFRTQLGTTTFEVNLTRQVSPLADARAALQLARIIRQGKYDIVHSHTSKAGLVGMLAARLAGVSARIHTIHGFPAETATGLTRHLLLLSERTTARSAKVVLVVSASLRDHVRAAGVAREPKLRILADGTACGVDIARFTRSADLRAQAEKKREQLGIPAHAPLLGFVGRLVLDKGIDVIVDAFQLLRETIPDVHLLLLGDYEPQRGRLGKRTIEAIEHHPQIMHVPFDWNPVPYYAAMDVLVLATLREGLPYILLEAAALEIPAVATRATGCVDAVVDGETGFLVDIGDVNAMARAVATLLEDEALRVRLGQAARARVLRLFTDDLLLQEHIDLYRSMLRTC